MKRIIQISFLVFFSFSGISQEICNNGIDDDLDGLIDLNDTTDCNCKIGVLPSIIPNPSFESFSSCPTMVSQMSRVNFWQDALANNSPDYYNCGFSVPATSTPFPHGTGAVGFAVGNGNGKEFIGTCLLDTLQAGISYNLQFQYAQIASITPRPIAIYGTANCSNLPYPRTPTGPFGSVANCPSLGPNWVTLDSLTPLINNAAWNTYTFTFTPSFDVTAIVIGPSCQILSAGGGQAYYGTIDNLKLSTAKRKVSITSTGHYCRNNLILNAQFDSLPNSFQWYKNGIALVNDTFSSYSIPLSGTGNYQILLNYNDGCLLSDTFLVDTPTIIFDYDSTGTCANEQTGTIQVFNISGGTHPYDFGLNFSSFQLDSSFTSLASGVHTIKVRDSNLCENSRIITIDEFPVPTVNFESDTVCLGEATSVSDRSSINKGRVIAWNWETPINSSFQNTTYTFSRSGSIPVTLTATSDSGCVNDTTLNIIVNPLPIVDFNFSPTSIFTFDTKVCFTNTSSGAINYYWNFDFDGPNGSSTLMSPCTVLFPDNSQNSYSVKLIGVNQFGCVDSMTKTLIIKNDFILYIPNSFSPNEDNINDELQIYHQGIESLDWRIFNRWGEEIFYSNNLTTSWDGKHKNIIVPTGSYPYRVVVKSTNGEVKEVIGHINVIK